MKIKRESRPKFYLDLLKKQNGNISVSKQLDNETYISKTK